jgi:hypothetical protein
MEKALHVTIFSYFLAVVLSAVPFFIDNTTYFHNLAYILPIMAADVLFVHTCLGLKLKLKSFRKRFDSKTVSLDINYNYLRKETLIALAIGLIAFVCGALVRL